MQGILKGLLLAATVSGAALSAMPAQAAETDTPIKIVVTGITDADFIANVFAVFLERKGYKVERVMADYAAQFVGLESGDMDISTSIWDTSRDVMDAALATGKVQNMGSSGVKIREGWWFPEYVKEVCPGLPDWKALTGEACIKALSTPETAPKARFVQAPSDWTTLVDERIAAFGLEITPISSGNPAALSAAFVGAIERKEPVIGWGFMPHWLTEENKGEFVAFPPFEPACATDPAWGPIMDKVWDCDNPVGYVWKVANVASEKKFPQAFRMMRLYQMDTASVSQGIRRVEIDGIASEQAAAEWLDANPEKTADWAR